MKRILLKSAFVVAVATLAACGNTDGEENDALKNVAADATNENEPDVSDESLDMDVSFPSAIHVAQILNNSGMVYTEGLVNPADKAEEYTTLLKKKLNFGAYSADLAYLVMNEKYGQVKEYIAVIRDLGSQTGMDKVFNSEDLVDRFEKNANNKDSLRNILIDINIRTQNVLDMDPVARLEAAVHFSGAWIEGMYLGSKTVVESKNKELGTAVVEQMNILAGIIHQLKAQSESSEELDGFIGQLNKLYETYNGFKSVKELNSRDSGIYQSPELSEEELAQLSSMVEDIRNSIVNV